MKYNQPYGAADPNASYVNGNPATGTPGSIPPAASIEFPQREIVDLITKGGLTPTNSDLGQLAKAIQTGQICYGAAAGTANNIVVVLSPAPSALIAGMSLVVLVAAANTAAVTINVNALGNKSVVHTDGSPLAAGDLVANGMIGIVYDGANWQLAWRGPTAPSTSAGIIDSAITKTVHGTGADFADLNAAFEWVSKYVITKNGSVTFNVAAGQYIYTSSFTLSHPNGDRITINGAGTKTTANSFVYTGNSGAALTSDQAANITYLRTLFSTELRFTSAANITINSPLTITTLLFTGDASQTGGGSLVFMQAGGILDTVAIAGSGNAGVIFHGGAWVRLLNWFACVANKGDGCITGNGGNLAQVGAVYCYSNSGNGVQVWGGSIVANVALSFICKGNGVNGMLAKGGFVDLPAAILYNNNQYGLLAYFSGLNLPASQYSSNGVLAAFATSGSTIDASGHTGLSGACSPALNTSGNANSYIVG